MITIKKGLDIPVAGEPGTDIVSHTPKHVALVGYDYIGMKPTMNVAIGDTVKKGQPVFEDKKRVGVIYTAPATGKVVAINRGERRVFESLVIKVDPDGEEVEFPHYPADQLAHLDSEVVEAQLVASGEWTAFRTRPFSRSPDIGARPQAIFVTAMDTRPLAFDPMILISQEAHAFNDGLAVLSTLSPTTYVCHHSHAEVPKVLSVAHSNDTQYHAFEGKHPAGLAGTHIHFLHPVSRHVTVWTIGYQDVIAIGKLFTTGHIYTRRLVGLVGPSVKDPHLLLTDRGADLTEILAGKLKTENNKRGAYGSSNEVRVISGDVLGGRKTIQPTAYLGRFHNQVSVLPEGTERPLFHYFSLGANRFSALPIYISQFFKRKKFNFTTSTHGSPRAMVPIGVFEEVMPQDYLPTPLLKALIVEDIVSAVDLGALELDEEDLGLCSFVSPGKYEFGDILRDNLTRIEQEG